MSPLRQRVLTAVPLLAALLVLLFVAPLRAAIAASAALMLLAAWEWSAFAGCRTFPARATYVAACALVMACLAWLVPAVTGLAVILWAALLWWALAFFWILRFPLPVPRAAAAAAGLLVIVPAWLAIAAILRIPGQGPELLLLALCIVFAADVGAYFAGHGFGRIKLIPKVSPGKTWEGVIGGLLAAALVAGGGGAYLDLPVAFMVPLGLGMAGVSVVGDLTVSMFKRSVGLKDSSHLIPGHGGVLDRLDSITAAMPVFALALSWLGTLPA